ncbi:2-dehydro-3-deoxygluconokinase/dehydrogluconokinase [Vreelandella songnenensis]|uniref:2-dehydro-3-deoxygluconokinase/dehydrogluconokinase n=1 Tax=Vreelandella songnenensis TaxID=1176243 RepID=A0A2T0V7T5_9GAMM|nr:sugar kinase [Halomonas songnenensis]PRY66252.1 2-dehydro-3-deoxygluconokinase/dehydrogluconokinase [Halomonas songnenensis]
MSHKTSSPAILTFGEAMAMLVANTPGELSGVESFHRRLAGADNNVAIGLSRLGFHVGWLSRVGNDSLGRFIQQALKAEGIDERYIHLDPQHPTGLMFKERAENGADPKVEYFRRGSAASHLSIEDAADIDFQGLTHLHATGITPALSESALELTRHLMQTARESGVSVSFDPNLRPSLWPSEAVMRDTLNELALHADYVLPGLSEGRLLTGGETPEAIADFYLERGAKAVIIKLGPEGSYYRGNLDGTLESFLVPGQPVANVVDTVGAGDGFAVGIISALLDGLAPRQALERGNLVGAQAVQVVGDMEGLPDRATLESLER